MHRRDLPFRHFHSSWSLTLPRNPSSSLRLRSHVCFSAKVTSCQLTTRQLITCIHLSSAPAMIAVILKLESTATTHSRSIATLEVELRRNMPDVCDRALSDGASTRSLDQALYVGQRHRRQADILCLIWLPPFQHSLHASVWLISSPACAECSRGIHRSGPGRT